MIKKSNLKFILESKNFIKFGLTAVLIDFLVYSLILWLGYNPSLAQFISFIAGAFFSYKANKKWTFKSHTNKYTPFTFSISYSFSLYINILVNKLGLSFSNNRYSAIVIISFLIATICSATINFLCLKFFVFNKTKI